ncbi:uncharacterized protein N7459_007506 [Penicillium hispanicum]|uniref:uncharacterized protein n=1 Tax=Penicillium hispanicum TaxID=1080232 RepID=UPI00253F75EE|nr:uncharacterized protein N7459_007506 [Penicillium hispanicum]KAJ5578542.1 hypothetical protein N7459_007506 [Penicillium hispanicum]
MDSPRRSRNRAACRRCQRRKIRCNGDLPQCSACKKANLPCINDGKQEVKRTYIANLQKRVQWLESLVKEQTNVRIEDGPPLDLPDSSQIETFNEGPLEPLFTSTPTRHEAHTITSSTQPHQEQPAMSLGGHQASRPQSRQAHEIGLVSLFPGGEPRYIGPSSGYFLANLVFSNAGRRTAHPGNHDDAKEPISLSRELFNSPTALPSRKADAIELSSKYFASVHIMYPFLHEPSHMQRLEKMYASEPAGPDPAVAFHVYMVLAIAASDLSRHFRIRLPAEGYYTAATQYFEGACAEGTLEGLQSLLLLMVYALHNPSCGVNIWSLNYQCLGGLIDLGLQRDVRASSAFPISFLEQEMRTRIFWVVYSFDRTLGTMMGRPIGVRDEACELRFPADVADKYLADSAMQEKPPNCSPSHMSYSIHLFKLSWMNSEIKYVMHSVCRDPPRYAYPPVPDIHQWQKEMIDRLESWRSDIPCSTEMRFITKFCETRYHELMILVLRPSPGIPEPPEVILVRCFQHAVDLLRGFGELYRQEELLYSRLIVHSIFLGTLIMLHCLWRLPQVASQVQIDDVVTDTSISLNILSSIGEYWAEAKRARDCIHELLGATIQRLIRGRGIETLSRSTRTYTNNPRGINLQSPTTDPPVDQADSAIDIAPTMGSLGNYDLNVDSTSWLNDTMPGGFMDFAGAPDFDSLMWEVFNST